MNDLGATAAGSADGHQWLDRIHIGIDCRLPYYRRGGIGQYVLNLLPALATLDGENRYTVFHSGLDRRCRLPPGRANFQRQDLITPCHHRFERLTLAAELDRYRLDVFHSPDSIPPRGGAKRRIVTVHDVGFVYYPHYLTADSHRYYADQIRWALRSADHIVAVSNRTQQDLIERLAVPPIKVTVIPPAAGPVYTRASTGPAVERTLARYGLGPGFVLFVGTIEPRKNLPTLLEAYVRLRRADRLSVPLVIVGQRGWRDQAIFSQIESLGPKGGVRHLTDVTDERLSHLYATAGLLALPSHYEGFGLPALEAMHCGCPVIASDRGALPEVVGQAGLLLDADHVEAWTEAGWQDSWPASGRQFTAGRGVGL